MIVVRSDLPKLCWAMPGSVIRVVADDGSLQKPVYMVIVHPEAGKRAARITAPAGLYDDERCLAMVDLETGIVHKLPHLSSRVHIAHKASVYVGKDPE